jgi:hypothetical protein
MAGVRSRASFEKLAFPTARLGGFSVGSRFLLLGKGMFKTMQAFAELYAALDETTRTNEKVAALRRYFSSAMPADAVWAVRFSWDAVPSGFSSPASSYNGRSRRREFQSGCLKSASMLWAISPKPSVCSYRPRIGPRTCLCIIGWRIVCCLFGKRRTRRAASGWFRHGGK